MWLDDTSLSGSPARVSRRTPSFADRRPGYATRGLSYGLASPYYVSSRYGAGAVVKVGWRIQPAGLRSLGTDSYTTPDLRAR